LQLLDFQRLVDQAGLGGIALSNRNIALDLEGIPLCCTGDNELLQRFDVVGRIGGAAHGASSICFAQRLSRVMSSRSPVILPPSAPMSFVAPATPDLRAAWTIAPG